LLGRAPVLLRRHPAVSQSVSSTCQEKGGANVSQARTKNAAEKLESNKVCKFTPANFCSCRQGRGAAMGAGDDKGGSSGALRVPDPSHPGSFHNLKHVDHLTHHTSVSGSMHLCSSGRAKKKQHKMMTFFSVVAHNTRRLPPLSAIPHSWPRLPALAHLLMPHDSNALLPCSSPTRSCAVFALTFQ
jgi:hypothetical protein